MALPAARNNEMWPTISSEVGTQHKSKYSIALSQHIEIFWTLGFMDGQDVGGYDRERN